VSNKSGDMSSRKVFPTFFDRKYPPITVIIAPKITADLTDILLTPTIDAYVSLLAPIAKARIIETIIMIIAIVSSIKDHIEFFILL